MPRSDQHPFRRPTAADIEALAEDLDLSLSPAEREDYLTLVSGALEGLDPVRDAPTVDHGLRPDEPRQVGGRRPDDDEDPHNAWVRKCTVEGADDGPLSGVTIGLKDSIALAGVELTVGSRVLEGFVPEIDATVASRLLDAGATIVGKLNMESFAWSGSGDFSDFGPVTNPHSDDHLAGGSSSGSGVAPAVGDCDVALGTDQAGSIRIPSAMCGLVGIKPTHGLVPYTGIVSLERSIDHVGPMAPTVEMTARTLEAIAGEDVADGVRLDARQPRGIDADDYADAVGSSVEGLRVGVLEEGFGQEGADPVVDETVRAAVDVLADAGAEVESVSAPLHRQLPAAWAAIGTQGGARHFEEGGATNHDGWAWPRLVEALDTLGEARADELPPTVKQALLTAAYLEREYGMEAYTKARDVALAGERQYDSLLADYDALAMPSVVIRALEKAPEADRVEALTRDAPSIANTSPFDLTGHPAISVPCAKPDGLPVGLMLVGAHEDERTLFALASAFEDRTDWEERGA